MTFIQAMTCATVAAIMTAIIVSGYGWMLSEGIMTTKEFFFCIVATSFLASLGGSKMIELHYNRIAG
jgi:hypothetical protein